MNNSSNFVIVTFVDENDSPGIVASNWIKDKKTCYYPNVRTDEMKNKLLKRMVDPESTWLQYNIRILKSYETYGEARLHLKKAEETSNLDSDEEVKKRKRKIKNVYLPDDTSSSGERPLLKMTQEQKKKKRNNHLQYPTPPKSKVNSDRRSQSEKITVNESSAVDIVITVPITSTCPSENAEETPTEVSNYVAMEVISTVNCSPNEAVNFPPEAEAEIEISKEVSMDINSAVNCRSIILPSSNQENLSQSEFNPDVEIRSKEVKKTQPCSRETVNCQSGCTTSKQFAVQQSHLIQVVTDLSNQVTELIRKVDILLGRSAETLITHTDDNADLLASLPIKDDASFEHFNNQLKINQNKQAIMSFLAGIGGKNLRSLTTNILRRIILDDVAELYSLTGKQMKNSSKKSFLDTEMFKLIFQICKKVYEDVTENKLKEIISDWLNQAKVRITRRAERQKKD